METYKIQIIETAVAIFGFLISKFACRYFVRLTVLNAYFKNAERRDALRLINLILFVVLCVIVVAIWSVEQDNVLIFASSLLTVFGVALFAEMSILSNVTACLILFFQHPIKVGDVLIIVFEGNEIEGELIDISYFFVTLKTPDRRTVTIPNALLLKTAFSIRDNSDDGKQEL